jgi:hypothetical protein
VERGSEEKLEMGAPRSLLEVRLDANRHMEGRVLGYRAVQVQAFVRERVETGGSFPSLGELKRELGFYDKAGALRALRTAGLR